MLNILTKGSLRDTLSERENRLVLALMIRESYKVVDDDDYDADDYNVDGRYDNDGYDDDDDSDDDTDDDTDDDSDDDTDDDTDDDGVGISTSPDAHLLVGVAEGS